MEHFSKVTDLATPSPRPKRRRAAGLPLYEGGGGGGGGGGEDGGGTCAEGTVAGTITTVPQSQSHSHSNSHPPPPSYSQPRRIKEVPNKYFEFKVRWFNPLDHLIGSERVGIIGLPGSGKSCCCLSLMYILRHLYGAVMVISGSEPDNGFYSSHVPKLFLHSSVTKNNLTQFVNRQRLLQAADPGGAHQHSLLVLDDVCDDPRVLDNKIMRLLYKQGRHIQSSTYLLLQYTMDCRPWMRSTTSAVILYANVNTTARKRIFDNFGSMFRTFDEFESIFDAITNSGQNTAMVIILRGNLPVQDAVFWYRADMSMIPKDFVAGHPRLQQHSEQRLDPKRNENMGLISCCGATEA